MKILIISPKDFPVPAIKGGAVETLINNLIDKNEIYKKMNIKVITRYDKQNKKLIKNYKYTEFVNVKLNNFIISKVKHINKFLYKVFNKIEKIIYNINIIKTLKNEEFDFVITEGGNYHNYNNVYKYVDKSKSIIHLHGIDYATEFLNKNFEYFLLISNFVKEKFIENGLIDRNRLKLLYNGIDIENFEKHLNSKEVKIEKEKYGIKDNEKVVLFVGRVVKEKGIRELLLAFKKIEKECNAKLLIVGNSEFGNNVKTEFEKELKQISEDIRDRIIFTGHIFNKELYKIYSIADIAVFPHLCNEAFGLTIVEAMASSVPIITTNDGAIPEIADKRCSVILEKDNLDDLIDKLAVNMKMLLNHDKIRNEMKSYEKKYAEKFSSINYYNNYVKILEELKSKNENRNINIS